MPGRNLHTNFRTGADLEFFTLQWSGLTVEDCQTIANSKLLENPQNTGDVSAEDLAASTCRLYRVASEPVPTTIYSKTKSKTIVEPSKRKFFSKTPVSSDKEDTMRYVEARDKKYGLTKDTGALSLNHLEDVLFAKEIGIKRGKLKIGEDEETDADEGYEGESENEKEPPNKKSRTVGNKQLHSDLKAKERMIAGQAKQVTQLEKRIEELKEKLKRQEVVNGRQKLELERAAKDRKLFESLQKRDDAFTEIGKELSKTGLDTPDGKNLLNKFQKIANEDIEQTAV